MKIKVIILSCGKRAKELNPLGGCPIPDVSNELTSLKILYWGECEKSLREFDIDFSHLHSLIEELARAAGVLYGEVKEVYHCNYGFPAGETKSAEVIGENLIKII